jgi:hypothetical protein
MSEAVSAIAPTGAAMAIASPAERRIRMFTPKCPNRNRRATRNRARATE